MAGEERTQNRKTLAYRVKSASVAQRYHILEDTYIIPDEGDTLRRVSRSATVRKSVACSRVSRLIHGSDLPEVTGFDTR